MSQEILYVLQERVRFIKGERIKHMYEFVTSICSIRELMKSKGRFMEWYQSEGFNKDEISVIIKRDYLYKTNPDKVDYISSLTDRDVKFLTHASMDPSYVKEVLGSRTKISWSRVKGETTKVSDVAKIIKLVDKLDASKLTESDKVELMRVKLTLQYLIS